MTSSPMKFFWILESISWKHFHQLLYTLSLHRRLLSWARWVEMTRTIYPDVTSKPSTQGSAQAGGTFHHTVPQVWHCVSSGYSKRDSETMSFGLCLLLQGHTVSHQMRRPLRMTQRKRSLTPPHWICPGTNVVSFGDGQENVAISLLQSPDFMKGSHLARLGSLLRPAYTFPCYALCGLIFLWAVFFQLYREHQQPQKRAVGKQKLRDQQRQAIPSPVWKTKCKTAELCLKPLRNFSKSRADGRSYGQRPTFSLLWLHVSLFERFSKSTHEAKRVPFMQTRSIPGLPLPLTSDVGIKMQSWGPGRECQKENTQDAVLSSSLFDSKFCCLRAQPRYIHQFEAFIQ